MSGKEEFATSIPPEDRPRAVREYLAAYFDDETGWQDQAPAELLGWFKGLSAYVVGLRDDDFRLIDAFPALEPFFADDPFLDGYAMYPDGVTIEYVEEHWGGAYATFFDGFVAALLEDLNAVGPELRQTFPGYEWLAKHASAEDAVSAVGFRPSVRKLGTDEAREQLEILEAAAARSALEAGRKELRDYEREHINLMRAAALHRAGDLAAKLGQQARASKRWREAATLNPRLAIRKRLQSVGEEVPQTHATGLMAKSGKLMISEVYRSRPKAPVCALAPSPAGALVGLAGGKTSPNVVFVTDFSSAPTWARRLPPPLQGAAAAEGIYVVGHQGKVAAGDSELHLLDFADGHSIATQSYPAKTGRLALTDRLVLVSGRDSILRAFARPRLEPAWTFRVPAPPIPVEDEIDEEVANLPFPEWQFADLLATSPNGSWITFSDGNWDRIFLLDEHGGLRWSGVAGEFIHGGPIVTDDGNCVVAVGQIVLGSGARSGSLVTYDPTGNVMFSHGGLTDSCHLVLCDDGAVVVIGGGGKPRRFSAEELTGFKTKGQPEIYFRVSGELEQRSHYFRLGDRVCAWDTAGLDVVDLVSGSIWSTETTGSLRSAAFADPDRILVGGDRLWLIELSH